MTLAGRTLRTDADNTETARQWEASFRYERELSHKWAIFLQYGSESDPYAGFLQRDNSDAGGKYFVLKSDAQTLITEAGLRYKKEQSSVVENDVEYSTNGRLYVEYSKQINTSVSGKIWVEYLPNFSDNNAYLANAEASATVMMSQILSLKVAYLSKYHNELKVLSEVRQDTSFTTALVAKF
jgi:putative salt-induced outer membrane protein